MTDRGRCLLRGAVLGAVLAPVVGAFALWAISDIDQWRRGSFLAGELDGYLVAVPFLALVVFPLVGPLGALAGYLGALVQISRSPSAAERFVVAIVAGILGASIWGLSTGPSQHRVGSLSLYIPVGSVVGSVYALLLPRVLGASYRRLTSGRS